MNAIKGMFAKALVNDHIDHCKTVCKESFKELSPQDFEIIDSMLRSAPEVVSEAKAYAQVAVNNAQQMDVKSATRMMQRATQVLQKPSTQATVDKWIHQYGKLVSNPRNMQAIGSYLSCVVENLDQEYKEAAVAAVEMLIAFSSLVSQDPEVRQFLQNLGNSLKTYVLKPVQSRIQNSNANSNSAATTGQGNSNSNSKRLTAPNNSNNASKKTNNGASAPSTRAVNGNAAGNGSRPVPSPASSSAGPYPGAVTGGGGAWSKPRKSSASGSKRASSSSGGKSSGGSRASSSRKASSSSPSSYGRKSASSSPRAVSSGGKKRQSMNRRA